MNQPWNEIRASNIPGVVLDCNLQTGTKIGGGTATDNTAAINAVLATASATNPIHLILDGGTITTGLVISSNGYTWLQGIGPLASGIYVKSGSNADAIQNGIPYTLAGFAPTTAPPAQTGPVIISDFYINGNRGNGTTGNSNSGNPRGITGTYWYCNIALYGIQGLRISRMYIYDSPTYSIRLANCNNVKISFNDIYNPNATAGPNNDCVHINAPAFNVSIVGNTFNNNTSDDGVAFNAPEGYPNSSISNCEVVGNSYQTTLSAMRCYGNATNAVSQVVFSGNSVYTASVGFNLGVPGSSGTDDTAIRNINITGNSFYNVTSFIIFTSNAGTINVGNNILLMGAGGLNILTFGSAGITISNITISNMTVYRSTLSGSQSILLTNASLTATISKLTINGFRIADEQGTAYAAMSPLMPMVNLTISLLHIANLDWQHITTLADTWANITSMTGNWQPESNIQSKTAAYTILPTDRTIFASTTSASFAVTLPATSYAGQKHTIKNTGTANTLTITGTVDGSANPTLTTLLFMTVEYDGAAWRKVG